MRSVASRWSVVLAVLAVQLAAFAAAMAVGQPTLYALFALGSAAALAAAAGGGLRGALGAAVGTALLAALSTVVGGLWLVVVAPVLLTAAVGVAGGRTAGVAAATLGTVLLVALGLPLALFATRQDPGLVAQKAFDPEVHRMLYLSIYGPLLAALVATGFGVPLAYLLARGFPGRELVQSLVDLPLVVPHSVAGILILFGFGRGGAFPQLSVLGTMTGMVLALAFVSAPFAVNAAREAFETLDRRVEFAARVHGAGPVETFRRVTLPITARSVLTGGVLAWARGVSEFGAVAVVAYSVSFFYLPGGERTTAQHAPVYIYNTYISSSDGLAESGAVAAILLVVSVGVFLLVRWLGYDADGGSVI